jgi:transposase InsO family protein
MNSVAPQGPIAGQKGVAMSHDHTTPSYAGPVPEEAGPVRTTGINPVPQTPSDWLQPTTEPVDGSPEFVVIEDEGEPAPPTEDRRLRGPRSRPHLPYGQGWRKSAAAKPAPATPPELDRQSGEVRLKILDTWMRSGLPAGDFAPLVNVSKHTLYSWKQRFEEDGPAGLMDRPKGSGRGSRLSDITKRAILLMKQMHQDWGVDRISDMLLRTQALQASPPAVAKVLAEDGYVVEHAPAHRHEGQVRHFERAKPNQMWQTDLFTFILKRQNQRVYLVGFMDDHSRFITTYGLHTSQSGALVIETLRAGIGAYGVPQEVLTDNGSQYITWRGTSQFQQECKKRGITQIVSSPRHPQTLGKVERFWGSLWRECVDAAVFQDLADARTRIGHFIDYYNFQRPHQGINGMVPADRFFSATPAVLASLKQRVADNALELARHGVPKAPLYLTGNVGGTPVVLHAEGDRVIVSKDGARAEVDFDPRPTQPMPTPAAVGADPAAAVSVVASAPMPQPATPSAAVPSAWTGAEEQLPGVSVLDGEALQAPVGGA